MRSFYVGQLVRIVSCDDLADPEAMALIGQEAVVNELDCENEDGDPINIGVTVSGDPDWCFWPWELEPLTPPHEACDPEFAESIRRLTDSVSA